ncbi:MAG: hypothetical protein PHN44_10670 [Candidatus Marinimicrobia bacterium]|jgi:hypothetical protein|nr:hypothetical protein [Candidatus Neomarinimicrobiota bacterium]
MAKAPAFQFYVRDWLSDPQLKMASHQSKGIWIDMLCYMWESPKRGELSGNDNDFCRLLGVDNSQLNEFLNENDRLKFASVTISNGIITVQNRRMIRDEKERRNNALRQAKYKSNAKGNAEGNEKVTPPSSSSSSFKKKNNKKKSSPSQKIEFIDNHFQNIPEDLFAKWKEVAPGIDIEGEIKKAELWLISHPDRKRSRYSVYLSNWMNKAQENFIRYGGLRSGGTGRNVNADRAAAARESVYEQSGEKDSLPAESRARIEALRKASRDAGRDDAPDFQDG